MVPDRPAWLASAPMSSLKSASERRDLLKAVYEEARGCVACPLHETRTNVVFGSGNADAELMFVGEAPGANEDQQGLPFVGQAGKLLEKLLGEIGMERGDVFIANTLKCRPPGNRDPYPHELDACRHYLDSQLELIQPTMVCTLGNFATKLLRGEPTGISKIHGQPEAAYDRAAHGQAVSRSTTPRLRCTRPPPWRCCAPTSCGSRRSWRSAHRASRSLLQRSRTALRAARTPCQRSRTGAARRTEQPGASSSGLF